MKTSIKDHLIFFDGYFDAVGRLFSTSEILISPTVREIHQDESIESLLSAKIVETIEVEKMAVDFEKEIADFLNRDPRERVLYYLIEYFDWFNEFSESCVCNKYKLSGSDVPEKHIAYILSCNKKIDILIYLYEKPKNA
jgi:hypothetical protein